MSELPSKETIFSHKKLNRSIQIINFGDNKVTQLSGKLLCVIDSFINVNVLNSTMLKQ